MEKAYRVYCSTCNRDIKRKMTWKKYISYIAFDGKTKGYHEISIDLLNTEPTTCPFGHPIKSKLTVVIEQ